MLSCLIQILPGGPDFCFQLCFFVRSFKLVFASFQLFKIVSCCFGFFSFFESWFCVVYIVQGVFDLNLGG